MESTISTIRAARHAGCNTTDEIAAYAAAKWECSTSQARTQMPPFEAYLHRVDRENVLLTVQGNDRSQILGWDKVVLVRDCGEVMKVNASMHDAFDRAMPQFFETVSNTVVFELVTHDNSVTIDHGETVIDSSVRASCARHAQRAANSLSDGDGLTEGTAGAHALSVAIDAAAGYHRTHVVVIVADAYRNVDWDTLRAAKDESDGHVYVTAITVGDHAQDMMPIADNVVHWCVPDVDAFISAMYHANSHLSTGLRMSLRTQSTEKPYFSCQILPSVRQSTPNAKTIIGGRVCDLLTSERQGIQAFMRRDIEGAEERGVKWCGERMLIRNDNLRQWVPAVDTTRVSWQTFTRNVPLVCGVPFCVLLRLSGAYSSAGVTVQLENGNNIRSVSLKASRARTLTAQRQVDHAALARWRGYVAYMHGCAQDLRACHIDEIITRAPSSHERGAWMEQKRLLQSGHADEAARKRDHYHMIRVHQTE